jgi:hypothetical protein
MAISSQMTTAEFRLMLSDDGVQVVCGAVNTFGLLGHDDHVVEGEPGFPSRGGAGLQKRGELVGRQILVTVLSADFADGALAIDAPITVGGNDYVIRLAIENSHMALKLTTLYLGTA